MQTIDERDQRAREALSLIQFPTFEQALDTLLLNRIGQVWAQCREDAGSGRTLRDLLISKNAGHYVELLTHDEIRDFRRRNRMSVTMPEGYLSEFMDHVESSLRRTNLGHVLRTLDIAVETRRDRNKRTHIVFLDKSPRS